MSKKNRKELNKIILQSVLLVLAASIFKVLEYTGIFDFRNPVLFAIRIVVFAGIYSILGLKILFKAIRNVFSGQVLDENFLMVIASIGAFFIGEYIEGVAVITLYSLGELFQQIAVGNSRKQIQSLARERADIAHLEKNGEIFDVSPFDVAVSDIIIVKPGEKIPLDGVVLEGSSDINMMSLTGESAPVPVSFDDNVFAGTISENGLLRVKVTKLYTESSESKIIDLVENSTMRKSKTEKFITKFATYYTPAVVISAAIIAIVPGIITGNWGSWIKRALSFLVISCPCALVISIPLAFFAGIGKSSKKGILIKGADYLEKLSKLETLVFDKTGTITTGDFKVLGVYPHDNVTESQLLSAAFSVEKSSNHPIAKSICEYASTRIEIGDDNTSNIEELPGLGISCERCGEKIYAGNSKLFEKLLGEKPNSSFLGTVVYIIKNNQYLGSINVGDVVKNSASQAISALRKLGTNRFVMLSGDRQSSCEKVSEIAGISEVYGELHPEDKLSHLERIIMETKENTGYVGDGINDAPSLALSDVGFAMGEIGQDAAIDACDVVIMSDDLTKIPESVKIARKTVSISRQNIVMALGVKFAILILAVLGISSLWLAVFADVGVLVLAILNSMRVMR